MYLAEITAAKLCERTERVELGVILLSQAIKNFQFHGTTTGIKAVNIININIARIIFGLNVHISSFY